MSYTFEQKNKGKTYVYKVESFWDKEKKQARQKRIYLGRKDEFTGQIKTKRKKIPIGSYNVGALFFLEKICEQLNLLKTLSKIYPDNYEHYLHLAFFKIIKREPFYLYDMWCQEAYVSKKNFMSSQKISNLLCDLGRDQKKIESFFSEWISQVKGSGTVMFDITSFSSYSMNNEFLEKGYNRDGENLEQINLGLISRKSEDNKTHTPIAYRIYPGSIPDVKTLSKIIEIITSYKLDLDCLVMDKGFSSVENIKGLHRKELKYLIPMSFRTKLSRELSVALNEKIKSPSCSFTFNEEIYSHCKESIKIGGFDCTAHIFLDKERRVYEESVLMKELLDFMKLFLEKDLKSEEQASSYMKETLGNKKRFLNISDCTPFKISLNEENINEESSTLGIMILITNSHDLKKTDILSLYRNKDIIEKVFFSFKHDINGRRSRVHSLMNMRGSIFINFLSLILISHIDTVMKDKKLYKKMSKIEIYKMMDRLKFYELATGDLMLGELSKKQKDIFSAFQIDGLPKTK